MYMYSWYTIQSFLGSYRIESCSGYSYNFGEFYFLCYFIFIQI